MDIPRRRVLHGLGAALAVSALRLPAATFAASAAGEGPDEGASLLGADPAAPRARGRLNVWAATTVEAGIAPHLRGLAPRVFVPHELGGDIAVVDPATFAVVDRYRVGRTPHHVTPSYDLS